MTCLPWAPMRKREARQREKEHDLEVARRMRVNEEQETEIEALQAILGSDIRVDDNDIETDHDYPRAFSINVVPHPAGPEENYSFVDVVVRYGLGGRLRDLMTA